MRMATTLQRLALTAWIALIALGMVWEGWAAPAAGAPPGLWLTIKSLPLLLPLFGLLHGRPRHYLLACLLVLPYFCEGVALSYHHFGEPLSLHRPGLYALLEIAVTLVFFFCAALWLRLRSADPD
jgi:uncharacterized membrane protein